MEKNQTIKIFYSKYKENIVPFFIIIFSFLTIFFLIVPQFQDYLTLRSQEVSESKRVEAIKNNIQTLQGMDLKSEENDFKAASLALPSEKDFVGILQAISKASSVASVSLGDFSFLVGDLSTKSAKLTDNPSIAVSLAVSGNIKSINQFAQELSKVSPVAQISTLSITGNSASITIYFSYSPTPSKLSIAYDQPIPSLTESQRQLLNKFRVWQESNLTSSLSF